MIIDNMQSGSSQLIMVLAGPHLYLLGDISSRLYNRTLHINWSTSLPKLEEQVSSRTFLYPSGVKSGHEIVLFTYETDTF